LHLKIAVVGSGISGLSAAWLLSRAHDVTLFENEARPGGHSHTVEAPGGAAVDMGFIVYNAPSYPNLVALFDHLNVPTEASNMGFAVSLNDGRVEYGGDNLVTLFSQWSNLVRPRFWSMLRDLVRFYREAPAEVAALDDESLTLGDYLDARGYGQAFQNDHLIPQAAAIWSASPREIRAYPVAAFIRFYENHGLLKITGRPEWRTVDGGSREYVQRLLADFRGRIALATPVGRVETTPSGPVVHAGGMTEGFDAVVVATHADQGLALLDAPTERQSALLGAFGYTRNETVLHSDRALMPKRKAVWSAWNYLGRAGANGDTALCVTYWMNRLQNLPGDRPLFVTLNPIEPPAPATVIRREIFHHPRFDAAALRAQKSLWSIQGDGGVWWCGAYFGAGFHEDGLQSGLAVAEAIGGVRRPWSVERESSRIFLKPACVT
jgi:predicted NAD/FAD-binding protein